MRAARRIAGVLLGLSLLAGGAAAQTADEDSVQLRPRPEYDPAGLPMHMLVDPLSERGEQGIIAITLGSFLAFPSLGVETYSTDNLFLSETGRLADQVLRLQPRLDLRSDWDNHYASLGIASEIRRHRDNRREDFENFDLYSTLRLNVTETNTLELQGSLARYHERGVAFVDRTGIEPTAHDVARLKAEWSFGRDMLLGRAIAETKYLNYHNTAGPDGPILQDDRDRWEHELRLRLGLEAFEGTMLYVEPGISRRRYDHNPADFPGVSFREQRDSDGWQLLVGLTYDASAVTYLDLAAGFTSRTYENTQLRPVSGVGGRLELTWNPTDLITLRGFMSRSIEETTVFGFAGYFETAGGLTLDYELNYNIILQATGRYARQVGRGRPGFSQVEEPIELGLSGTYMLNEYLKARAGWRMDRNESSVPGVGYHENQLFIRLDMFY